MKLRSVNHRFVAAGWIVISIVPVLIGAVSLVNCCVLPFHRTLHKIAPLCDMAMHALNNGGDSPATRAMEPRNDNGRKKIPSELTARLSISRSFGSELTVAMHGAVSPRDFISLGALRCDEDVGLRLTLLNTFRI